LGRKNRSQLPPGDPAALTGFLREALPDASRLRAMGAESYRIVREDVNLEKMTGVFIEALNRVRN
jgi:hypothetical protein